jgi:hypothetical protein
MGRFWIAHNTNIFKIAQITTKSHRYIAAAVAALQTKPLQNMAV